MKSKKQPYPSRFNRRRFVRALIGGAVALPVAGLAYSRFEAGWLRVRYQSIRIPRLPEPFRGVRVAFLTDMHHGPYTSIDYVQFVVTQTNALKPDLVLMGGDYVHRSSEYIEPCMNALGALRADLGTFGVLGNHDHWEGADATRQAMHANNVLELTNSGTWLERQGSRLRIAGVGDLWEDRQDLDSALGDCATDETSLLVSHNPDFAESIRDDRVGLVLSGHTHGGQIVLPVIGAPRIPSRYGDKYLQGLVRTQFTQAFISRGLGTVTPPLRFCCRPEIALITLT